MDKVKAWLSQTSTRTGLLTVLMAASGYLLGGEDLSAAIPQAVVGVVGLAWPDNAAAAAAGNALGRDVVALEQAIEAKATRPPA